MGSNFLVKSLSIPRFYGPVQQLLRCFSLSATNGVLYPQSSQPADTNLFINDADFVFRHAFAKGPFAAFKAGRLNGLYRRDPRQEGVILKLQELHDRLNAQYKQPVVDSGLTVVDNVQFSGKTNEKMNWFSGIVQMMKKSPSVNSATMGRPMHVRIEGATRGLYLYGGVGVGKTMLMDMFVATKPTQVKLKRIHYHDFMLDIHAKLKEQSHKPDPLAYVAESISKGVRVLALDEFFVTDVADAMIINRLFKTLWDRQLVLLATSNRKPDDLYLGGLQRDLFLPFIDNLKEMCDVHDMESEVDYRKLARHNKGIYFTGETRHRCLMNAFQQKSIGHSNHRNNQIRLQMGRKMLIPLSSGKQCYFTFDELCGRPVGSADYLGLCQHFHTLFIQDIPIIDATNKSAAYRLVTLIDILYDNRIRMFCSAKGHIHELFGRVISYAESREKKGGEWVVDDSLSFAKERTISRLIEMESMEYLVEHANRHAPELLLALAEAEEQAKTEENKIDEAMAV